jgi:hypothetical protein
MQKATPLKILLLVIAALFVATFASNFSPTGFASVCPKISQASLSVETTNCSSIFNSAISETRTHWNLEKNAVTESPLQNPQDSAILYDVKVTEGPTNHILVLTGQLKITNGGQQIPTLESVVANLQTKTAGNKFTTYASAVAVKALTCKDGQGLEGGQTCFGQFLNAPGATITLTDLNGNDVTAYLDTVPIPPSTCANPTLINYKVEFDLDKLNLGPGAQARLELLTTFAGAGPRGNSAESVSCTKDVNCNGIISGDNPQTCQIDESETNNIRTVATRKSFIIPGFVDVCPSITKTDAGASSLDSSCVQASSNSLDNIISKQSQGAVDNEQISGIASCMDHTCTTNIVNAAQISCSDGRNELIEGSPASATISAVCIVYEPICGDGVCEEPENEVNCPEDCTVPPITKGDFCTYTQGGWGAVCHGGNPGCIRDNNFASTFPNGLLIGHASTNYRATWTSSSAIKDFLPATTTPDVLTENLLNPVSTSAGVFAGQITALTLSVKFDDAGILNSASTTPLGNLHIQSGPFAGLTVRQLLALANDVVGGNTDALASYGASISDLNNALDTINNCFDNCASVCSFVGY